MTPLRIALVGVGKIARDQHLPAIAGHPDFELVATVDTLGPAVQTVPHLTNLDDLLREGPAIDAVALCTPPQIRCELAARALAHGVHVLLEKPPGATLSEVEALSNQAQSSGLTLFAAWHSRFAAGVAPAKIWLADKRIDRVSIIWREDVRVWHPGQSWIWAPGGLGVFDPGINALSIVTAILPQPIFLTSATLTTPTNRAAPIAAKLSLRTTSGAYVSMDLDWRQVGPQSWDIIVETNAGVLKLSNGGSMLSLPSGSADNVDDEYASVYDRFASLIRSGHGEVDIAPLRLVADAFLSGTISLTDAFHD